MSQLFARMRLSAFANTALQGYLGTNFQMFRFFDRLLPQGQEALGTCVRVTTVSQITDYLHNGRNPLTQERVQIDIIDADNVRASDAASAVDLWLESANFVDNREFILSPVRTPGGPPANFKLNQRGGLYPAPERMIPVESLDYRIYNVNT